MAHIKQTQPRTRAGPYRLADRPAVTRIRHRSESEASRSAGDRRSLRGFPPEYRDIVDFIVAITQRIWMEGAVGLIYDTYDPDCVIYTAADVGRGVEGVVAATIRSLASFPEVENHHLNVAWDGDDTEGFYTSHLGFSSGVNVGDTPFGAATGRAATVRFCADCVTLAGRIHTEWLARDNGAFVRQLGFDLHEAARALALTPPHEFYARQASARPAGQTPPAALDEPRETLEAHLRHLFHDIWNRRRLDLMDGAYAPDVRVHTAGGRVAQGVPALRALHLSLMASMPDCGLTIGHVCWSDETDGVIGAVRWELAGTARRGGWLGALPEGVPLAVPGMTHCRLGEDGRIVEEWTVWDEVGVLAQAYRAAARGVAAGARLTET